MHPVLWQFEIGNRVFTVYAYGTMLMLALVGGWLLARPRLRKREFPPEQALAAVTAGVICALLLARLLYVLTTWKIFAPDFPGSFFDFGRRQGLVAYGGFLGGCLGSWLAARACGRDWLKLADAAAPSLALGLGLTRIGCFLAGCDYGRPTDSFLGITFPRHSFAWLDHLHQGLISAARARSLPVHPTQLYAVAAGGLICIILLGIDHRHDLKKGSLLAFFFVFYGLFRFAIEFIRGDADRGIFCGLSTSQWLALATLVAAGWFLSRRSCPQPAPAGNPGAG